MSDGTERRAWPTRLRPWSVALGLLCLGACASSEPAPVKAVTKLLHMDTAVVVDTFATRTNRIIAEQQVSLLSMKFVPGGTLDDVITRVKELPQTQWNGQTYLQVIDDAMRSNELSLSVVYWDDYPAAH